LVKLVVSPFLLCLPPPPGLPTRSCTLAAGYYHENMWQLFVHPQKVGLNISQKGGRIGLQLRFLTTIGVVA
jgi:hypothetical protein